MQHPRIAAAGAVLAAALVPAAPAAADAAPEASGPGGAPGGRAEAPAEGGFAVRITPVEQDLRPGDALEYTVEVENRGGEDHPDAVIVQLLPPDLEEPRASDEGEIGPMQATWKRGLPADSETFVGVSGHVGEPDEGFERLTTIACVRPRPGAGLVDCASHTMPIAPSPPLGWIAGGGAAAAAVAAGVWAWRRGRPAPPVQERPLEVEIEQVEPAEADPAAPVTASDADGERARPVGADRE
ncbi:DUF11 domain-containing protein [Nocardiopsis sp. RSe5-2]|uniref:DUF11 domain-containing protein n=1 Tax=Nocardiopsis endophytica TaxID=3018445 RepID=A0ABT4U837_9ACTN|nr:DUF11 domain-containing protein [Nocardiopsis endophytica]MDA2813114.1 DUF11 domain-containing protein [Nocardiopsis endophytica]